MGFSEKTDVTFEEVSLPAPDPHDTGEPVVEYYDSDLNQRKRARTILRENGGSQLADNPLLRLTFAYDFGVEHRDDGSIHIVVFKNAFRLRIFRALDLEDEFSQHLHVMAKIVAKKLGLHKDHYPDLISLIGKNPKQWSELPESDSYFLHVLKMILSEIMVNCGGMLQLKKMGGDETGWSFDLLKYFQDLRGASNGDGNPQEEEPLTPFDVTAYIEGLLSRDAKRELGPEDPADEEDDELEREARQSMVDLDWAPEKIDKVLKDLRDMEVRLRRKPGNGQGNEDEDGEEDYEEDVFAADTIWFGQMGSLKKVVENHRKGGPSFEELNRIIRKALEESIHISRLG